MKKPIRKASFRAERKKHEVETIVLFPKSLEVLLQKRERLENHASLLTLLLFTVREIIENMYSVDDRTIRSKTFMIYTILSQ